MPRRGYRVTRSRPVVAPVAQQAGGVFCDMFTGGWRCHHTCHQRALAGQRHTEQRARSKMNRHEYRPALFQLFGDVFVVGTALLVEAVIRVIGEVPGVRGAAVERLHVALWLSPTVLEVLERRRRCGGAPACESVQTQTKETLAFSAGVVRCGAGSGHEHDVIDVERGCAGLLAPWTGMACFCHTTVARRARSSNLSVRGPVPGSSTTMLARAHRAPSRPRVTNQL